MSRTEQRPPCPSSMGHDPANDPEPDYHAEVMAEIEHMEDEQIAELILELRFQRDQADERRIRATPKALEQEVARLHGQLGRLRSEHKREVARLQERLDAKTHEAQSLEWRCAIYGPMNDVNYRTHGVEKAKEEARRMGFRPPGERDDKAADERSQKVAVLT